MSFRHERDISIVLRVISKIDFRTCVVRVASTAHLNVKVYAKKGSMTPDEAQCRKSATLYAESKECIASVTYSEC
eukprot:scaffold11977_cov107-Cylindrotheca_fusiformis.AAC.3